MKIFYIFWFFYKKLWVFEPRKLYFSLKGLMGRLNLIGNLYYSENNPILKKLKKLKILGGPYKQQISKKSVAYRGAPVIICQKRIWN